LALAVLALEVFGAYDSYPKNPIKKLDSDYLLSCGFGIESSSDVKRRSNKSKM